jgi:acyl homoserine lactone synthase
MDIQIGRISEGILRAEDVRAMHELRYEVFRERLQWDVPCTRRSEIDCYDALDPMYMIVKDDGARVCGCWRILPTTGPYMLKDTFPQLLCGHAAPRDPAVWELSRFALGRHVAAAGRFSGTAIEMMERLLSFALENDVRSLITVTTVAVERLLKALGIPMRRYGIPVQVGIERTVGFSIDATRDTLDLLRARRRASRACETLAA